MKLDTIGKNIRKFRLARKLRQEDLAEKTDLGTDSSVTPDFTEADDFLKFIQKNRRSVPSKERIADKDKFIKTVYELSNSFEIDADLIEFAKGYIANIYVDYACYTGYIKKLLAILFILADDISFLDGSKENADMLFSFTYHTHHIFLNNRETTDFS
jgi:transcriptional regulator with XRE-family HTH domain